MYQYRIFRRAGSLIRRIFWTAIIVVGFLLSIELIKIFAVLRRLNPVLGYGYLGCLILAVIVLVFRLFFYQKNYEILKARGYNLRADATHASLKRYNRHLVKCAKRLASQRVLTDDDSSRAIQKASDIEDAVGHHPLNDDLTRGISHARDELIAPLYGILGEVAEKITASKACAIVQDIYHPPFPAVPSLVVFYHQFTLVSEITDLYLPNPSMREYYMVQRDVWKIMAKGDFMRYGQRLFSGINTKAHRLGRSAEDLGQVFSIIWLTYAFSEAATIRCCTLHDWKIRESIKDMQRRMQPCLQKTRDTVLNGAMPIIKKRIRTYAPVDRDPELFVSETAAAFSKAVDAVIQAHKVTTDSQHEPDGKRTSPGLVPSQFAEIDAPLTADSRSETTRSVPPPIRVRKQRRRRRSRPKENLFQQIIRVFKRSK